MPSAIEYQTLDTAPVEPPSRYWPSTYASYDEPAPVLAALDQFYGQFQTRIDGVFRDAGYGPDRFQSLLFPGAQHNEASWNSRLDVPLTFLLSPAPRKPREDLHA